MQEQLNQVLRISQAWKRAVDNHLKPHKINFLESRVLLAIKQHKGKIKQTTLSQFIPTDSPHLTRILDSLENKGFLTKIIDPKDKRNRIISLTGAKKEALTQISRINNQLNKVLAVSMNEKEQQKLQVALAITLDTLDGLNDRFVG